MNESNFLKTLDKLTNGSRLMNESEIMEFLSSVVSIVDKYKQGTDEVNSSLLSKMDETLDIIEQIVTGHTENTTNTLSSAKSELETLHSGKLAEIEGIKEDIQMIYEELLSRDIKDGKDGYTPMRGVDYLTDEEMEKIKDELWQEDSNPEEIRNMLSTLEGDERLDAKHIKNIPMQYVGTGSSSGGTSTASGNSIVQSVSQPAHGLVVGDVVRLNGTIYVKAQADTAVKAEAIGIVTEVADVSNFKITTNGWVTGLTGLIAGEAYYLSTTTLGALDVVAPIIPNLISKPVFVAANTTSGYFTNYRGTTIVDPSGGASTGGVTSVAMVDANGITGSVANPTTTPSITLGTSLTGIVKGNGTAFSVAVANTDYQAPLTITTTGTSGASTIVGNVLNIPQYAGGSGSNTAGIGLTLTGSAFSVNTSQNITTLSNLTSDGVVRSSGGSGALSILPITGTGNVILSNSPTLATPNLGTPTTLVGTNITGTAPALTAGTVTTNANLTGEVTSVGNATTVTNSAVIGKVLTGYTSGAGTVVATDSVLQAIQKLNGNTTAIYSGNGIITQTSTTTFASRTITGTANQITVTNGDGVAGNPTMSLPLSMYSGSVYMSGAGAWGSTPWAFVGDTNGSAKIGLLNTTSVLLANNTGSGISSAPAFTSAATGTHNLIANVSLAAPLVTPGGATIVNGATMYIATAPTFAANNYAVWVDAGVSRFDGDIGLTGSRVPKVWAIDMQVTNAIVGSVTGNATTVTTNANLTGEVTSVGNAATVTNSAVIGKVLTGYVSGAGTVVATDSILQAIQKLNGNTSALTGAVIYQGTWNATTNTPALASGVGTKGFLYKVSIAGTTTLDGISQWGVGDSAVFNGTTWDRIDGGATEVDSVFGRVGNVVSANGDYTAAQVTNTPAGNIAAVTVQAALNELDTEKLANLMSTNKLIGRGTAGTGVMEEVTLGTGLALSGTTLNVTTPAVTPVGEVPTGLVNSVNVTYTLSQTPIAPQSVFLTLNGIAQQYTSNFTISGNTITFTDAPISTTEIYAIYQYSVSAGPSSVALTTVGTSGASTLVGNVLNIPQYTSGITWSEVTSTSQSAITNNGYITNNAGVVAVTLPVTATVGSTVLIQGSGVGGWRLSQNTGQVITKNAGGIVGTNVTTTGVGGFLSSSDRYDSISIMCITSNTGWVINTSKGTINIT